MKLSDFKYIYFMEWAHRMWGRIIGIGFILPAMYFGIRGYMSRSVTKKVIGLAGLIGFQVILSSLSSQLYK